MKKLSAVLVLAVLVAFTAPVLANPFSDVPFSHWAYDAVKKLTEKGIMTGMPDGTFKGEKGVSRYELAVTLARALDKMGSLKGRVDVTDIKTLEKLTVEFADELALLGVKVTALEDELQTVRDDIAVIKADAGSMKGCSGGGGGGISISGDSRIAIDNLKFEEDTTDDDLNTYYQIGLNFSANIDEDISTFFRVVNDELVGDEFGENIQGSSFFMSLAYVDIKSFFDLGDVRIGRQFVAVGNSIALDDKLDSITFDKDIDQLGVTLFFADQADLGGPAGDRDGFDMKGIDLKYAIGDHDAEFYFIQQGNEGAGATDPTNLGFALAGGLVEEIDYLLEFGSSDNDAAAAARDGSFLLTGLAWDFTDKLGIDILYGKGDEDYDAIGVYYHNTHKGMFGNMAAGYGTTNGEGTTNTTGSLQGIKDIMVTLSSELSEKTDGCLIYEKVETNETDAAIATSAPEYKRLTIGLDHQYAPNTSLGLRYDTVEYDVDATDTTANAGGWNRIRVELQVKF
ncbi:MAG: S-layer homology domain-containing protein [bacterium]|jgi:hypothetical protein|nr:S-layer homology domain-containing protein [bacterium]